jgi:hypothetical protein
LHVVALEQRVLGEQLHQSCQAVKLAFLELDGEGVHFERQLDFCLRDHGFLVLLLHLCSKADGLDQVVVLVSPTEVVFLSIDAHHLVQHKFLAPLLLPEPLGQEVVFIRFPVDSELEDLK